MNDEEKFIRKVIAALLLIVGLGIYAYGFYLLLKISTRAAILAYISCIGISIAISGLYFAKEK